MLKQELLQSVALVFLSEYGSVNLYSDVKLLVFKKDDVFI